MTVTLPSTVSTVPGLGGVAAAAVVDGFAVTGCGGFACGFGAASCEAGATGCGLGATG